MNQGPEHAYIGYEYKEVSAAGREASLFLDCYESFGWIPDENRPAGYGKETVTLYLKRDRKIINKMELTRLQRNFESCVQEIRRLERSEGRAAAAWASIAGGVGTALMAGSVFAVTSEPPHYVLMILLAIPAFAGWLLSPLIYRCRFQKQSRKIQPLIEAEYEEIYRLCEKGHALL